VLAVFIQRPLDKAILFRSVEPFKILTVLFLVLSKGSKMSITLAPKELAADVAAVTPKKLKTPLGKELVGSPLATAEPVPVR
jgi:hypothetical protein